MNKLKIVVLLLVINIHVFGQNYYQEMGNKIILDNDFIKREISFFNDSISSVSFLLGDSSSDFINKSKEFSFSINNKEYNGFTGWLVKNVQALNDSCGGKGVKIILGEKRENLVQLELNYLLYPNLPIVRKWINISNNSTEELKIESLIIEDLETDLSYIHSVIYHNYARMKHLGYFVGNWDDPLVVVHNIKQRRGMALGNEAVGVLKRTAFHTRKNNVEIGLTQPGQDFPFRKWLKPGGFWESPKTFICLYNNSDDGFKVVEEDVNKFMIQHMSLRIIQRHEKPIFVYNTWNPFRTFINDTLIHKVAKVAANCGVQEFVIDDGWQINYYGESSDKRWGKNYGDWLVDEQKFKGGLKPTFNYIKKLGMKPGLWISIASATSDSKVFIEHPEWFVQNIDGKPGNLHFDWKEESPFYSGDFGTNWYDYIKETILRLVEEHGLAYAKLDLAVVTSPYINDPKISGSYASDRPFYKDHDESFIIIYERLLKLFDELHAEASELFIDCTFETAGKLQLMDYAIAQHAEGNWLSNFEEASPLGPLRIRQMAWWRTPVLPAASLVIGNLQIDDPDFEFSLKSLIGTFPIVLGDPRKIDLQNQKLIKTWSDWLLGMQEKYDYMTYRKDIEGFGEPREGAWDGWQRINFQSQEGGIFGVFRQGALEKSRTVFLKDLNPDKNYFIRKGCSDEIMYKASGKELMQTGFTVQLKNKYDAEIFEVGIE